VARHSMAVLFGPNTPLHVIRNSIWLRCVYLALRYPISPAFGKYVEYLGRVDVTTCPAETRLNLQRNTPIRNIHQITIRNAIFQNKSRDLHLKDGPQCSSRSVEYEHTASHRIFRQSRCLVRGIQPGCHMLFSRA
jgi:hypothetical protein